MAAPKLKPLEQWICDTCRQLIRKPEHGYFEYRQDNDLQMHGFRIVHHAPHSPHRHRGGDCYYADNLRGGDYSLEAVLGPGGSAMLTSWLDYGAEFYPTYKGPRVRSLREWVDFQRRVQLPYYEEARKYLAEAHQEWGDTAPDYFYAPEALKRYIEQFSEEE